MKKTVSIISVGILLFPMLGILHGLRLLLPSDTASFSIHLPLPFVTNSLILAALSSFPFVAIGMTVGWAIYRVRFRAIKYILSVLCIALFFIHPVVILDIVRSNSEIAQHLSPLMYGVAAYGLRNLAVAAIFSYFLFSHTISGSALDLATRFSSKTHALFFVLYPQIGRHFFLISIPLSLLVFFEQDVPSMVGYRTYGEFLFSSIVISESPAGAVASVLPIAVFGATAVFATWSVLNKFYPDKKAFVTAQTFPTDQSKGFGIALFWIFILLLVLGFFVKSIILTAIAKEISPEKLAVQNSEIFVFSVTIGILSALLAMSVARLLYRSDPCRKSSLCGYASLFYFFLPSSVLSLSLLQIRQILRLDNAAADYPFLILGYLFSILPVAYFLVWAQERFQESGRSGLFGEIPAYRRFFHIQIPQKKGVWFSQFLILFLFAFNNLDTPILLAPAGVETVTVKIYNLMHYGDSAGIVFLGGILIFFAFWSAIFVSYPVFKGRR